jgi:hypothetical protein
MLLNNAYASSLVYCCGSKWLHYTVFSCKTLLPKRNNCQNRSDVFATLDVIFLQDAIFCYVQPLFAKPALI